jgi:cobalt-zinc-cadmium efflux system outer membrane protein
MPRSVGATALLSLIFGVTVAAQGIAPSRLGAADDAWTLETVLTTAVSQHPLVDAARSHADATRGQRLSAGVLPNPVATFWVENTAFPYQALPIGRNRETSTYVTWPIESFLQRSARIRRADGEVNAADAAVRLAERQVATDAARAFFHVALAQALADEAEENRSRLEQLTIYNQARVDEGITPEAELLRLQVEVDRAATEVALADVELIRARAELAPYLDGATGSARLETIRVAVPNVPAPAVSGLPSLEAVVARAHEQRPELGAARARVVAAAAAAGLERTTGIRQLGATFGNKRVEGTNTMIAGVSMTVPLFDRNGGGIARAVNDHLATRGELAWAERTVASDVQRAHESAVRLVRQLADLQQSFLSRAEDVQRLTLGAYQEGGATLLQVLDATRLLADARLTYARALFAQRQSLFELAISSGAEPTAALDLMRTWSTATLARTEVRSAP